MKIHDLTVVSGIDRRVGLHAVERRIWRHVFALLIVVFTLTGGAVAADLVLAPTGTLRAAYIAANLAQARRDPGTGAITGVVADITRELGRRAGVPITIAPLPTAAAVLEAVRSDAADIGFVAPNPERTGVVLYSQTYMLVQQSALVRTDSPLHSVRELDRPGQIIGINTDDSVGVWLQERLTAARLRATPDYTLRDAVQWLQDGTVVAFAGGRQRLTSGTQNVRGLRLLDDNFYGVPQTIAVPLDRSDRLRLLNAALDELRANGYLADSVARSAVDGLTVAPVTAPSWIRQSDEFAQIPLAVFARYAPEAAGQVGVAGVDREISDLRPDVYERYVADTQKAAGALRAKVAATEDPRVRQDLEIMIMAQDDAVTTAQLRRRFLLEYIDVAQIEFSGIRALLDPQIPKDRQTAALVRLRRYAGLEQGTVPLARLAIDRTAERLATPGLTGPYVNEVNKALDDTKHYVDGIRELFQASGIDGWQEPLAALQTQLRDYNDWVRAHMLPRCRTAHRLPPEIYADNLKQIGVDIAPTALIAQAQFSFAEIQNQLRSIAAQVARQRGLPGADYRDVLRELKKEQLVGDAILRRYESRLAEVEAIIARERIVTLPDRKANIRLATAAETAQTPAAHMVPPRLLGNTGEYGEFVLPLNLPGDGNEESLRLDDATSDAASWTLVAHEARPGHELQFASIVERGVSIARAVYAQNSVNTEGWALYAEAEMQPYEPPEGQLFALQWRMVRAARAFLDPMLNLGLITPERAADVLRDDVVLSRAMVKQEIDRYTFFDPGQAASYYYGYMRLMQLRAQTELALGPRFDRRKFNDFVLGQGLLPPALLQKAVETEFVPGERSATKDAGNS